MSRRMLSLALPLLALACASQTLPEEELLTAEVRVARSSYLALSREGPGQPFRSWGFEVISTLRNTGLAPLFLTRCDNRPIVYVAGTTGAPNPYARFLACGGEPALMLLPGHTRTDTTWMWGPSLFYTDDIYGIPAGLNGQYAVGYHLRSGRLTMAPIQVTRAPD